MTQAPSDLRLERGADGVRLWIHVTPRARRERVGGVHGDALRVQVREPPVAGAANAACARLLAGVLRVPRRSVEIDPGSRSRRKRVQIIGDPELLEAKLLRLARDEGSC